MEGCKAGARGEQVVTGRAPSPPPLPRKNTADEKTKENGGWGGAGEAQPQEVQSRERRAFSTTESFAVYYSLLFRVFPPIPAGHANSTEAPLLLRSRTKKTFWVDVHHLERSSNRVADRKGTKTKGGGGVVRAFLLLCVPMLIVTRPPPTHLPPVALYP